MSPVVAHARLSCSMARHDGQQVAHRARRARLGNGKARMSCCGEQLADVLGNSAVRSISAARGATALVGEHADGVAQEHLLLGQSSTWAASSRSPSPS